MIELLNSDDAQHSYLKFKCIWKGNKFKTLSINLMCNNTLLPLKTNYHEMRFDSSATLGDAHENSNQSIQAKQKIIMLRWIPLTLSSIKQIWITIAIDLPIFQTRPLFYSRTRFKLKQKWNTLMRWAEENQILGSKLMKQCE